MHVTNLQDLELFITYSVQETERASALSTARRYAKDRVGMLLLAEYYTNFPDVSDEGIHRIAFFRDCAGVRLFVLSTEAHQYLVLASDDSASILGEYQVDEIGEDVLAHFGFSSMQDFLKMCKSVDELPEYAGFEQTALCPVCGVREGELHFLGCPVEVCPWCDAQLNTCNCRFEHLDEDELTEESQLEEFQDLLEAKGRIPFARNHGPSYPGSSAGLDTGKK